MEYYNINMSQCGVDPSMINQIIQELGYKIETTFAADIYIKPI